MKQLLILSGKGGTGKTTVASAFIRFSDAKVYADRAVNTPNLHLVMSQPAQTKRLDYYGRLKAKINFEQCVKCGLCESHCRFNAIMSYQVDPNACEGCGVCQAVCPEEAVSLIPADAGEMKFYDSGRAALPTDQSRTEKGDSEGQNLQEDAQATDASGTAELAIIDGSPGNGFPAISGVDMVLIVTEPSVSDIFDMKRIIKAAQAFQTMTAVCINKYDTNLENSYKIEVLCNEMGVPFVGRIPFDPEAVEAINSGRTIADVDCPSGRAARGIYGKTLRLLQII